LLGPHDPIPEMDLREFVRLMRERFDLASEWIDGKPHYVRLIGSPFNSFVEGCRSIGVMAHDRGRRISPHNIKQVLEKFKFNESDFREAYNAFYGLIPQDSSKVQTRPAKTTRPN
jgi:hypothetical protein